MNLPQFESWCAALGTKPKPLVPFDAGQDRLHVFDFTANNLDLPLQHLNNTTAFSAWVFAALQNKGARYGVGGVFRKPGLVPTQPSF